MWGVHLWLPKAHVEAPVRGSIILAGILLKLGGYGLIKIYILGVRAPATLIRALIAIRLWRRVLLGLVCLRRVDLKVLIAYSSVIHIGLMTVGIITGSVVGWTGAILMIVAHAFRSPGIFSMSNFNYEVVGRRNTLLQKGLGILHPLSSLFWFLLLRANIAAPPSLNLASELLISISIIKLSIYLCFLIGLITFMAATYNLFLFACQQGKTGAFNFSKRKYDIKVYAFKCSPLSLCLCHNHFNIHSTCLKKKKYNSPKKLFQWLNETFYHRPCWQHFSLQGLSLF